MSLPDYNNILVLGDSVSKGVVLDSHKNRYVFYKHRFIEGLKKRLRPKICDYSKYGATTDYGRKMLDEKFDPQMPSIVFVEYGSNDCDYKWEEVIARPYGVHLPCLSLAQYEDNLRYMLSKVKNAGGLPVLCNLHPLCAKGYLNWFTKNDPGRRQSVMKWLRETENIYWWQEMYSYTAELTAESLGVHVVDIRGAFLKQPNYKELLCPDGIHPTEAGQSLIENVILDDIEKNAPELLV